MKTDFLKAAIREKPERVPIWFMRQAGRYIPEYLQLREKYSMEELIRDPSASAEITLLPFKHFELDAAILFSDLLVILWGFGVDFEWREGPVTRGPKMHKRITKFSLEPFDFMKKEIKILKKELSVPLIGFTSAPFTLASYLIEGKFKRDFPETRKFIYREPLRWHLLMENISEGIKNFLLLQADAGCDALMLFDSWTGVLSPEIYIQKVFPYTERILRALEGKIRLYFSTSSFHLLHIFKNYPSEIIGIDWRTPLDVAIKHLGETHTIQGNLDPALLFSPFETIKTYLSEIEKARRNINGFIFNLGHGILPNTPIDILKEIIREVHQWKI